MQTVVDERNEVLLIDKPLKWTSFDVVNKVRYAGKYKKVGHAGTLDPLATGLLILCTNKKTKEIDIYQAQEKEYIGTLVLGKTTPSVDLETDFDAEYPINHITQEAISAAIVKLTGIIEQIPPAHSAIKVDGKRAYESARKGEEIKIKSRQVEIKTFEIDTTSFPELSFRIVCSKGTYIRSLVRDFGKLLQSGAYMSSLRRTRIGDFKIENALTLEQFLDNIRNFAPNQS
ncbi:tRNA pseudouridine(55) synthase TruB [Emticicia sp. BO119]|uniref:tRNA pseudouridine(55) synthase TruB n=1 Tax=Emticicia sp. BO119 TaxID=2757768 RepID=UPI0015F03E2A|nr:tRNA pseudouridine(55) synthase TruB [Emticicia sp. BO119]MBA4850108.1 tRNA pseudouridine(55) synthase TruB [Emticicia sp. BO119]